MRRFILPLILLSGLIGTLSFRFSDGERWKAPEDARKLTSPLKAGSQVIADGKYLFKQNCKSCHGQSGKGDGPVAKTLKVKCADLTSDLVQQQTDGELYYKLSIGRAEMPGFREILTSQERWSLVHYLRTLNDAPDMTNGM